MLGPQQLAAGAQFFLRLPAYLRRPLTIEQARASLADRLGGRNEAFVDRLRRDVFAKPAGPYAKLLRHAGCELGDLEASVAKDGLEDTLTRLFHAGVYLTVDEFKGRKPAKRGSLTVEARPELLQSPRAALHLPARSGGSRGQGTPVLTDLAFIRTCAGNAAIALASRGGLDWVKADWESPGAGLRFRTVKYAGFGKPTAATFSQIDPASVEPYYLWNLRLLRWAGALAGRPIPWPTFAPLSNPAPLADWLVRTLRSGGTPHVFTFPGSAVILAQWAKQHGYDISGAWFTISGEPITAARLRTIRSAGCHVIPRYGTLESGAIGYGCLHSAHADDLHVLTDMHALIHAGERGADAGLPPKALLMTALHPRSPFVMLNLSMGDQAEMGARKCGCPLEAEGWERRIWNIRSFEKLTCGAVTFDGAVLIPVLEERLPARFGGAPTDYQLAEAQQDDGEPVLELVVHPRVGRLDPAEVSEEFLAALSARSASDGVMIRRWRDAGTLRVVRREPSTTRSGKISYLHA